MTDPYGGRRQPPARLSPQQDGQPQQYMQPGRAPAPYAAQPPPVPAQPRHTARAAALTAAEKFWYVLGCIAFGAMYFAKIPSKKALADFGLAELTSAEAFWYILMCIAFGGGYFAKIPTAKALSELEQFRQAEYTQLEPRPRHR